MLLALALAGVVGAGCGASMVVVVVEGAGWDLEEFLGRRDRTLGMLAPGWLCGFGVPNRQWEDCLCDAYVLVRR